MTFYKAKISDILRTSQRDDLCIMDMEQKLHKCLELIDIKNCNNLNRSIPTLASIWYYLITSVSNLQTIGEEYSGTIRVDSNHKTPSKSQEIIWLIVHVGGEPLIDRFLAYAGRNVSSSSSLQDSAKSFFLRCIQALKEEKLTLKKIHNALFYVQGKYYYISHRIAGIQYVLLREWMEDDTFTGSFFVLGHLSLFYMLLNFVLKIISPKGSYHIIEKLDKLTSSEKECVLCTENIQSPTCTPCGHVFCWNCLCESLQYQKNCPICREDVNPSRIIFLQNLL